MKNKKIGILPILLLGLMALFSLSNISMPIIQASPATQTWQIQADLDDCLYLGSTDQWDEGAASHAWFRSGAYLAVYGFSAGALFFNVTIPQAASITSAYFNITCSIQYNQGPVLTRFYGHDVDNSATFSTKEDYKNRIANEITYGKVDWDITEVWTVDNEYQSPDLKDIVQEIVDRAGWSSGNNLTFFWEDDGTTRLNYYLRHGYAHDASPSDAPTLTITWKPETIKPAFNVVSVNNTLISKPTEFKCNFSDNEGLSHWRIEQNNSGTAVNSSWSNTWTASTWASYIFTLNDTANIIIAIRFFANDTNNNVAVTAYLWIKTQEGAEDDSWAFWFLTTILLGSACIIIMMGKK